MTAFQFKLQLINRVAKNLVGSNARQSLPQMSPRLQIKQDHVLVISTKKTNRSHLKMSSCLSTKPIITCSRESQPTRFTKLTIQRTAQLPNVLWNNKIVKMITPPKVFLSPNQTNKLHLESLPSPTSQRAGKTLFVWYVRIKMKSSLFELMWLREVVLKREIVRSSLMWQDQLTKKVNAKEN